MKEPKIRFKGFKGEWETSRLDCCVEFLDNLRKPIDEGCRIKGIYPYYGASGIVDYVNDYIFDEELILLSEDGANITDRNYPICFLAKGKYWVNNHAHVLKTKEGFVNYFVSNAMERKDYSQYNTGMAMPKLNKEVCKNIPLAYPHTKEQQSIASFFTTIDAQISASTSRLASLKQIKAASLQAMFPQEGETVPKLRFKGFEGEWAKVSFKKLYEPSIIKNKTFGADKIISVANMYYKPISYISDEEYLQSYNVMNLGDIAFEGNRSKNYAHGRFVENTIGDGIVSHVFIVLKPISKQYDLLFWKYLINNESIMGPVLSRCTKHSTMMTDLVVSDFLNESILIPSFEEQKHIGSFLQNIDRQITLQSQRLEKLKQIKAACLDKMFV